jgi:transposase-like protein
MPLAGHPFSLCRPALLARLVWLGRGHEGDHHRGPQFTDCVRMVHYSKNLLKLVGSKKRAQLAEGLREVFACPTRQTALEVAGELADRWRGSHPQVAEHIEEHIEECLSCLAFPASHRKRIRTTNGLERLRARR